MKITIAPVAAGPSWGTEVILTSGLYASPEDISLNATSAVDVVSQVSSTAKMPIDRGNESNVIRFKFTDQKASFQLSEQDLILYKATLPRFGLIRFYAEGALTTVFAYMIASVSNFTHTQIGITTIRTFTLSGGAITTSLPSPPSPYP